MALLSDEVMAWRSGRAGLQFRLVELGMEELRRIPGWGLSQGLLLWLGGLRDCCGAGKGGG
jgi:hypothetical protein